MKRLPVKGPEAGRRAMALASAGHAKVVQGSRERFEVAVDEILDGGGQALSSEYLLGRFSRALEPRIYRHAFISPGPVPLREVVARFYPDTGQHSGDHVEGDLAGRCLRVVQVAERELSRDAQEWARKLEPWSSIVEVTRESWGDRWAAFRLANLAAGIRTREVVGTEASNIADTSVPLCMRARFSRVRPGAHAWWRKQLESTDNPEYGFALLLLFTWGSVKTVLGAAEWLEEMLVKLPEKQWLRLFQAAEQALLFTGRSGADTLSGASLRERVGERVLAILSLRINERNMLNLYNRYLAEYAGDDPLVWRLCSSASIQAAMFDEKLWIKALPVIVRAYENRGEFPSFNLRHFRNVHRSRIPLSVAKEIVENQSRFPCNLVHLAEQMCRRDVAQHAIPLGRVAVRDRWFAAEGKPKHR